MILILHKTFTKKLWLIKILMTLSHSNSIIKTIKSKLFSSQPFWHHNKFACQEIKKRNAKRNYKDFNDLTKNDTVTWFTCKTNFPSSVCLIVYWYEKLIINIENNFWLSWQSSLIVYYCFFSLCKYNCT